MEGEWTLAKMSYELQETSESQLGRHGGIDTSDFGDLPQKPDTGQAVGLAQKVLQHASSAESVAACRLSRVLQHARECKLSRKCPESVSMQEKASQHASSAESSTKQKVARKLSRKCRSMQAQQKVSQHAGSAESVAACRFSRSVAACRLSCT